MKHILKFLLLFSILIIVPVHAMSLRGKTLKIELDFEPNLVREDTFSITNQEGYTSTYNIFPYVLHGADITSYFTITPNRIENLLGSRTETFTVKLVLPESIDIPGETENRVKVRIDSSASGVLKAVPSLAIRYIIFVLYPFKYIEWSFSAPHMNINETKEFAVNLQNLGEPTIDLAYADVSFISLESGQIIRNLKTNTENNISSKETKKLNVSFNSANLKPGNYKAIATLYWDTNVSVVEKEFRIGTKQVKILNFTKLVEVNAITKFDIIIQSGWNTKISDIYADITVYDINTGQKLREFKSLNTDLNAWQTKTVVAYFDTKRLEKGEYKVVINLRYEGVTTTAEGIIRIDENIDAEIVEEIPGKFKLDLSGIFTPMNILILLLILFIIINIVLGIGYFKNRPPKPKEKQIDPAVIEHVRQLKQKYNDNYIKEMMLKKGWSKEKIKKVLNRVNKK